MFHFLMFGGHLQYIIVWDTGRDGKKIRKTLEIKEVYLSVISNVGESNLLCKPLGVPSSFTVIPHAT